VLDAEEETGEEDGGGVGEKRRSSNSSSSSNVLFLDVLSILGESGSRGSHNSKDTCISHSRPPCHLRHFPWRGRRTRGKGMIVGSEEREGGCIICVHPRAREESEMRGTIKLLNITVISARRSPQKPFVKTTRPTSRHLQTRTRRLTRVTDYILSESLFGRVNSLIIEHGWILVKSFSNLLIMKLLVEF